MLRNPKIIKIPKVFTLKYINEVLSDVEFIFKSKGKALQGYTLDLTEVRKINVLGMLILYKIIEYSVEKECFFEPNMPCGKIMERKIQEYEFLPMINSYINEEESLSKFKELKIQLTDNFILAPQPLLRGTNFTNNYIKNSFLPKIREYYKDDKKVISMIFTCFSEVLTNFWEHAVLDTKSILIAHGNRSNIEISCADTGDGIITTLKKNPKYASLSDVEIIKKSVQKDVTSKEFTDHMGFGLWIIDRIVSEVGGKLALFSEGIHYSNDRGKITVNKTGCWQGTIVYITLPISTPKSLYDIDTFRTKEMDNLKIDFVCK